MIVTSMAIQMKKCKSQGNNIIMGSWLSTKLQIKEDLLRAVIALSRVHVTKRSLEAASKLPRTTLPSSRHLCRKVTPDGTVSHFRMEAAL